MTIHLPVCMGMRVAACSANLVIEFIPEERFNTVVGSTADFTCVQILRDATEITEPRPRFILAVNSKPY